MKSILQELVNQVRCHTLRLLEIEDAPWQLKAPPGTSNHFIWHAGHILWVQDLLSVQALKQQSQLPSSWADKFGSNCQPVSMTNRWPSITDLHELLSHQHDHLLILLDAVDEISRMPSKRSRSTGWGLLEGIVHACHDEARHHGEMYLLYKMSRSPQLP